MKKEKFRCMICQKVFNEEEGVWSKYNQVDSLICKGCKKKTPLLKEAAQNINDKFDEIETEIKFILSNLDNKYIPIFLNNLAIHIKKLQKYYK